MESRLPVETYRILFRRIEAMLDRAKYTPVKVLDTAEAAGHVLRGYEPQTVKKFKAGDVV